jgi:ribose 5-phosphate isomerase A
MTNSERALELIPDGSVVGLGTGRAATAFLHALGQRVKGGLRVRGVPTSEASAKLARELGIPLTTLDEVEHIDIDVDGADEVDPNLNLIKGLGGALLREKVVAAASRQVVILVGAEKVVPVLGSHGVLPVEVVPFGLEFCRRRLRGLGFEPTPRRTGDRLVVTDNGNHILDCEITPLAHPAETEQHVKAVPGVVEVGLFLSLAHTALVQDGDEVLIQQRPV